MVTLMIIMIMMAMITIMMLMMMRRMKPSLWLKILSKLISPVFSRYLIITDLTIIKISFQVLIKSISILISQKNYTSDQPHARIWQDDLFARPSSWKIVFCTFLFNFTLFEAFAFNLPGVHLLFSIAIR